jgi:adenylate cyclase
VKGKNEPERIHTLIGLEEMVANETFQALRAANQGMLGSYRAQDWQAAAEALAGMEPLADRLGVEFEGYISLYRSRIAYFHENPPSEQWDGVYVAATK